MESEKTSFRQFEYCKLCSISHKKRKKHIYSKIHQNIIKNIFKKFKLKIQSVKKDMFSPQVQGPDFEVGAKFWCYFCAMDVDKHTRVELTTIVGGALVEHIASDSHKDKFSEFLWQNLVTDVKQLQPVYTLSPEDLAIFKNASFHAVKRYQKTEDLQRSKLVESISRTDVERRMFHQTEATKSDIRPVATPHSQLPGNSGYQEERIPGKRTVSVFAIGLSFVQTPDVGAGNMYTGATPPWLQPDDQLTSGEIGPSLHEYQNHLEQQRKAKLPANRVGAKFDQTADPSHNWLPSFGRVWSKGRRLQSKLHFEKEMSWNKNSKKLTESSKVKPGPVSTCTASLDQLHGHNTTPGDHTSVTASQIPMQPKPYKRRITNTFQASNNGFNWLRAPAETASTNQSVPYKRKRDEDTVSQTTNFIQTPVLASIDMHAH